jgi:mRNA interferase MazF
LSRDAACRERTALTVAPVTRTIRNIPLEVSLDQPDGMPARCVVNLHDITTLPKILIKQRITALSAEKIRQIDEVRFYMFPQCVRSARSATAIILLERTFNR